MYTIYIDQDFFLLAVEKEKMEEETENGKSESKRGKGDREMARKE